MHINSYIDCDRSVVPEGSMRTYTGNDAVAISGKANAVKATVFTIENILQASVYDLRYSPISTGGCVPDVNGEIEYMTGNIMLLGIDTELGIPTYENWGALASVESLKYPGFSETTVGLEFPFKVDYDKFFTFTEDIESPELDARICLAYNLRNRIISQLENVPDDVVALVNTKNPYQERTFTHFLGQTPSFQIEATYRFIAAFRERELGAKQEEVPDVFGDFVGGLEIETYDWWDLLQLNVVDP